MDRLAALLPPESAGLLRANGDRVLEIRLRSGRPTELRWGRAEGALTGDVLDYPALRLLLAALMEFSVYARQDELDRGFFTLEDGSRVGVCGRMYREGGGLRMGQIGSACIRVARQIPGSADAVMAAIAPAGALRSALLVSPPGMGKTTVLRDVARQLSGLGYCVGVADERGELAACRLGVPTLDVGARTDVMDGCPRAQALARMVRSMAPEVVVADEIGGAEDALALADAVRCGVMVVASAHGDGLGDVLARPALRAVLDAGVVSRLVALGPRPGVVREVWHREGEGADGLWKCA